MEHLESLETFLEPTSTRTEHIVLGADVQDSLGHSDGHTCAVTGLLAWPSRGFKGREIRTMATRHGLRAANTFL